MMGIETIKAMAREQGKRAQQEGKQPYVPAIAGDGSAAQLIPNFGTYRPKGWRLIETHFVDNSGFGNPGEPALTINEFLAKLVPGHGYAVIESGQFQVYVGEFVQIKPRKVRV